MKKSDKKNKAIRKEKRSAIVLVAVLFFSLVLCAGFLRWLIEAADSGHAEQIRLLEGSGRQGAHIYEYACCGEPYTEINGNEAFFAEKEYTTRAFEKYAKLDRCGRCGAAYANICKELMPTEERTSIGMIKPSGWHTVRYDELIEGNYLYNRCHLIAFMLAGENANEKNLITGTRYMNTEGMLPFEMQVASYVEKTGNHVLYRVTPIFKGKNLVASGVLMEASSVEDHGEGLSFCVYVYNVQPGIEIDYATGESRRA